jgi:hypothetical protein
MKPFLFLTRVGFILNCIFLLCMVLRYIPVASEMLPQPVVAVLLVAGWLLSILVNLVLTVWWVYLKQKGAVITTMNRVVVFNLFVFILQLLFYFL